MHHQLRILVLLLAAGSMFPVFVRCEPPGESAPAPVKVTVDCSRPVDGPLHLWGHVNVSRRAPPPVELGALIEKEFGRPVVTRCWLMLDQMWDYRTDEYRFDYEINRDYYVGDPNKKRYGVVGVTTGLHYYDYIDSVADHCDEVMLNIRRYEQEVLSGMITLEKWQEVFQAAVRHYKSRCPNLRYIEVLNEPTAKNQSNLGNIKHYYQFYRCAYQAINELNAELQPEVPLEVGGSSGFRTAEAIHLVHDFAKDAAPDKRLDFLSFHHYWANDRPAQAGEWEAEIDRALAQASLPTEIPIFVTEIGYTLQSRTQAEKNLWQAAGMTAFQYFARRSPDLRLFPWVQYHSAAQIALVQFDTDLRMTPYGAAVKLLRMHQAQEVHAASTGLRGNGDGVGALATLGDGTLVIEVWNLDPKFGQPVQVEVAVDRIPDSLQERPWRIRRYQVDSQHSNCFGSSKSVNGLEMVEEREATGSVSLDLTANMEPMSICLWLIEVID